MRISVDDLLCELRLKNMASLDEADYVILEQNGQISVFPKKEMPLSHPVVVDGILNEDGLQNAGKDRHWLKEILSARNLKMEDIFLLSVTYNGKVTLITQKDTAEKGETE